MIAFFALRFYSSNAKHYWPYLTNQCTITQYHTSLIVGLWPPRLYRLLRQLKEVKNLIMVMVKENHLFLTHKCVNGKRTFFCFRNRLRQGGWTKVYTRSFRNRWTITSSSSKWGKHIVGSGPTTKNFGSRIRHKQNRLSKKKGFFPKTYCEF